MKINAKAQINRHFRGNSIGIFAAIRSAFSWRELCGLKTDAVIIWVSVGTEIYPAQEAAFGLRVAVESHTDRTILSRAHRLFRNIHGYA